MREKYISVKDLREFPIRIHNFDKKNGSIDYLLGIESVFEFIDYLAENKYMEIKRKG